MISLQILATGISGGIGQAFLARAAEHHGWNVVSLARNPAPGEVAYDVTWDEARIVEAVRGMAPVDVLLCLHGADILSPPLRYATYLTRLQALYEVDVAGSIKTVRAVLPRLAPDGVVIFMGWDRAGLGGAGEPGELYALAKAALTSYAKSLAVSLLDQQSVYVVAPGWVQTRWGKSLSPRGQARIAARTRSGRWQTADEVAAVIEALLAFPRGVATGQVIYVNRGDVLPS